MKEKVKTLQKLSPENVELVFSDDVAMDIIAILNKFSNSFIGTMTRSFDEDLFYASLKFDSTEICNIFSKFYLEK